MIKLVYTKHKENHMYQYILFDLDGTLTDPKMGITTCVQYALKHYGIEENNLDKLEPFIGPPLRDSFIQFYGLDEKQVIGAVEKFRERFSTKGLYENEIYPGIADMLMHLKAAGKRLAIASSKPTVFVKTVLEHFSIKQYFEVIIGSELDGTREIKEEVVQVALLNLLGDFSKEKLAKTAMVGDRRFDIDAAKVYGITGIGVAYGYAGEGELVNAGADMIVDTVVQLEEILLSSDGKFGEKYERK